jgi:hypothetical protein
MGSFLEYSRARDIHLTLLENNLFYHRDFMRAWERGNPERPSAVKDFFDRLGSNLKAATGKGLEMIAPDAWEAVKSKISSMVSSGRGEIDQMAKSIPQEQRASDAEVHAALRLIGGDAKRHGVSFEEMRMYISILNRIINTTVVADSVERSAYFNALKSLIENPARFMALNRPEGGWSHVMAPVAQALSIEARPEMKAAKIVASAVLGAPEEKAVRDAVRKTLEQMSDAEVRSVVWADRRTKGGREAASRLLGPYGVDNSDLSRELESRPQLKSRFRRAKREKSEFRQSRLESPPGQE